MLKTNGEASCETSRETEFKERAASGICKEIAAADNPYLADRILWQGYDVFELMRHRDFVDVIFLLLKGELPSVAEKSLFENILVLLAHPGPRHPAVRALMNAGVSKTDPVNFLPIGMSLMSGDHLGASGVVEAMKFLARSLSRTPQQVVNDVRESGYLDCDQNVIGACFGARFGGREPFIARLVTHLASEHQICDTLRWGQAFLEILDDNSIGWLRTGLAAAVFLDMGFRPNVGGLIYQWAAGPALMAHGLEMSNKPLTAMPFVADEDYHYQEKSDA